jgi:hypothetical protein
VLHTRLYESAWLRTRDTASRQRTASVLDWWSLALIGNASGHSFGVEQNLDPRRFRSRLATNRLQSLFESIKASLTRPFRKWPPPELGFAF